MKKNPKWRKYTDEEGAAAIVLIRDLWFSEAVLPQEFSERVKHLLDTIDKRELVTV